jgi:hypothetical protein
MNKFLAASIVAISLAAAVPAVLSQTQGSAADSGRGQSAQRQPEQQRASRMPSERMEAKLERIRTALKITAAQQPQWDAYANVRRNQAAENDKRVQERRAQRAERSAGAGRMTVEERRERKRQRLSQLSVVEKPLYATLTPDQQRVADEVLAERGARRRGGGQQRGRSGPV